MPPKSPLPFPASPRSGPRVVLVLFITLIVAALLVPTAIGQLIDWWWFKEIGYTIIFTRAVTTELLLFMAGAVVTAGVLYLNLRIAQRGLMLNPIVFTVGEAAPRINVTQILRRLSLPVSLGFGLFGGIAAASMWQAILKAFYRSSFGIADPVFGKDLGFYVFTLPAIAAVRTFITLLLGLSLISLIAIYILRGDIMIRGRKLRFDPSAGMHVAIIIAVMLLLTAFRLWMVDIPNLVYSTTGPFVGASYTDMHARLPALYVSAVAAVLVALITLIAAQRNQLGTLGIWSLAGYLLVAVVGRDLVPLVMQKLIVAPTELTRETPYLKHHIAATRQAWGIDSVETRELNGEASLTLADIKANAPTIDNVRLWDRDPLLMTFGQLQEIRTYYDFVSIDDDRYWIDGKYRQVLLSPRELNVASLPTSTFINEHLTFTHGMGLTLGPVNQVTTEGLPVLFLQDLPPVSNVASLKITRPQIYYGELANDYVFVNTKQREFDHPSGEENVYAAYAGTGGVKVGNLFRRLGMALNFGTSKIFFSQDITSESRALYYRDIRERSKKALPFLRFDRDPYMVITADGKLKWLLDAYTMTNGYPYSQRLSDGTNYMRNSVKVVIDAYDGSVTSYVSVPSDPIIQTWSRIFPGIFHPFDSMPEDLRAHIRYPDEIYRIQTALYTTYHMESPEDFYHREDQWQIPVVADSAGSVPFMRHIVMRLPDEAKAEYIYMVPFTPRGKDNLAAWVVARNDGPAYGKLRVYRLSRQSLVFGPQQIENRINQNTEISRQVSLWDQRGSSVIRGDLLVIPINEALLYVQPLYLQAEGGKIPELKRVVVAYQNDVVMSETLEGALSQLFGGSTTPSALAEAPSSVPSPVSADSSVQSLVADARAHYDAAMSAQRSGDWARYGEEVKRVGEILERLQRSRP